MSEKCRVISSVRLARVACSTLMDKTTKLSSISGTFRRPPKRAPAHNPRSVTVKRSVSASFYFIILPFFVTGFYLTSIRPLLVCCFFWPSPKSGENCAKITSETQTRCTRNWLRISTRNSETRSTQQTQSFSLGAQLGC